MRHHVHVHMNGSVLFLKHLNKLLEAKLFLLFVNISSFSLVLFFRGFHGGLHVSKLV